MRIWAASLLAAGAFGASAVLAADPVSADPAVHVTPPSEQRPGYGVVESVVPLPDEESASGGASSAPASQDRGSAERRYLVRVRMDDGSIQVRSVKGTEVREGERALITNAGDVVPE